MTKGVQRFRRDHINNLSYLFFTSLAAVCHVARDFGSNGKRAQIFAGALSADLLYFSEKCKDIAAAHIATDDGSAGFNDPVTVWLPDYLDALEVHILARTEFYNCGPDPMTYAADAVQLGFVESSQMFSAIDYTTKCGVSICGARASSYGRRICGDGSFITSQHNLPRSVLFFIIRYRAHLYRDSS